MQVMKHFNHAAYELEDLDDKQILLSPFSKFLILSQDATISSYSKAHEMKKERKITRQNKLNRS
jgi:hypothetical protein